MFENAEIPKTIFEFKGEARRYQGNIFVRQGKSTFATKTMENPFEIIIERLNTIEALLRQRDTNKDTPKDEILNIEQTAQYLGVSKATMYGYTAGNHIPFYKTGKRVYFKRSDIDGWLTRHRIKTNEEIEQEAATYIATHPRIRARKR